MQSVVVTGVSTGIGWGITKVLIQHGFHVFGSVRKPQDAERLSKEFGERFVPLLFDVTDEAASTEDFRHQLEVNLVSVLIVTKAFVPLLGTDHSLKGHPGRILNMSSVSGKSGPPFVGAYAASKHGLEGFSESLRRELQLYGIDVIIIGPGPVATPIWDKAEEVDISAYAHTDYVESARRAQAYMIHNGKNGLPPEKVGEVVWHALTTHNPRVRYAVVGGDFLRRFIQRLLPTRVIDRIVARNLGFK
jgi:NAD(P)-dependent dehydrogenase (short-subunit alcohol dehydrogenase family)